MGFNPHPTRRSGATHARASRGSTAGCFNPHPTRRSGATRCRLKEVRVKNQFQSSPDPEVGCNHSVIMAGNILAGVSILTRPGGRVQRVSRDNRLPLVGFQSSPDPEVGCNDFQHLSYLPKICFNPHPTRRSGATLPPRRAISSAMSFQSSPDPEVGCNRDCIQRHLPERLVSILTRPGGRVQRMAGALR